MKAQVRVLGFDDAPFGFGDARVPVVGVVVRAPNYVEGVMTAAVTVDGDDATNILSAKVSDSRHREGLAVVLLDGIAFGGFNIVDLDAFAAAAQVPVATVTRERPDLGAMVEALRKRFPDWQRRSQLLERRPLWELATGHGPLFGTGVGIDRPDLEAILARCTVRGTVPEPLRLAHLMAAAIVKGESRSRP